MKLRDLLLLVGGLTVAALVILFAAKKLGVGGTTVVENKSSNPWVAAIDALPGLIGAFTKASDSKASDLDAAFIDGLPMGGA